MSPTKLFIAPFRDMSGYAALGNAYFKALLPFFNSDEWASAAIRYDIGSKTELDPNIKMTLKHQISDEIDTVVQMSTPNEMAAVPGKRNIGICCWETDRIPPHWAIALNAMDAIIVPCEQNKQAFEFSGVSKPIFVIPMPVSRVDYPTSDISKFDIPGVDNETTIYYNIAQWSHKKGIDAAVRSYFLAFQNNEKVLLLLKGYVNSQASRGDGNKLIAAINEIKSAMRLPRYPKIFITDTAVSNDEIRKLHLSGDCYVNMTRGEGWCIPAFESLLYGKELISCYHTAMADWVTKDNAFLVDATKDSVHNMPYPDDLLYTARECWYEPNVVDGSKAFISHFRGIRKNSAENINALFEKFSPAKVGQALKDVINGKE